MNKEIAIKWVNNMKPYGMKWSIDDINIILLDKNWNLDSIEFFIISNMIFNEYNNIILDNYDLAFNLSKEWLKHNDLIKYYKYKKKQ